MELPSLEIPKTSSLAEGLYQALKDAIFEGKLSPGDRLTELSVAKHVNISRTPVREALHRLQNERLLESSGRTLVVSKFSMETLGELCSVRETLEGLAAQLASTKKSSTDIVILEKINEDIRMAVEADKTDEIIKSNFAFHTFIWQMSQNHYLKQELLELRKSINRLQTSTLDSKDRQLETLEEHKEIIHAIKESDGELAEKLTRKHFQKAEILRMTKLKMNFFTETSS
jgi:DNA-binding GntR family transcriptional regulator